MDLPKLDHVAPSSHYDARIKKDASKKRQTVTSVAPPDQMPTKICPLFLPQVLQSLTIRVLSIDQPPTSFPMVASLFSLIFVDLLILWISLP